MGMTKDECLALLKYTEEEYKKARTNADLTLYEIQQMGFELECLRKQLSEFTSDLQELFKR